MDLLKSKRGLQGFVIILNLSENKCTRQIKARTQDTHYKDDSLQGGINSSLSLNSSSFKTMHPKLFSHLIALLKIFPGLESLLSKSNSYWLHSLEGGCVYRRSEMSLRGNRENLDVYFC